MTRIEFKKHHHNWQRTERHWYNHLFKLFVCIEHDIPIVQAYDVIDITAGMKDRV